MKKITIVPKNAPIIPIVLSVEDELEFIEKPVMPALRIIYMNRMGRIINKNILKIILKSGSSLFCFISIRVIY
jgi:hypothetical protein